MIKFTFTHEYIIEQIYKRTTFRDTMNYSSRTTGEVASKKLRLVAPATGQPRIEVIHSYTSRNLVDMIMIISDCTHLCNQIIH